MKVIIAGSRTILGVEEIDRAMQKYILGNNIDISEVVSGGARGVDSFGESWAIRNGIQIKRFPADWELHGKKAGILRNKEMGKYADILVAVWDGQSRGTGHMVKFMRDTLRKPVYIHFVKVT